MQALDRLLEEVHRASEILLGNQSDPLDEAVYIILSFQTDLARFKKTWRELRSAFARWDDVECTPEERIADVLRAGGLHRQKAKAIKRLLRAVRQEMGELSLDSLRELSDVDAERLLARLPGLSWKGARCVLLYSLNRLNVATSRARCVAVVVASPDLIRVWCRTPRQMQLANALARFVEVARSQAASPSI